MKKIVGIISLFVLFFVKADAFAQQFDDSNFHDGLYEIDETSFKRPMPMPIIREADIMWEKTIWRDIDFRQKMNLGFYYPIEPHRNMKRFFHLLIEAIISGEITAYDAETKSGELVNPINKADIDELIQGVQDHDLGKSDLSMNDYDFFAEEVLICRVKEKWYFDKQRSQMMVRILSIAPVLVYEDATGKQQTMTMFMVPYDENTRNVLSKSYFYNRHNSANLLTYDDVFMSRLFDSYITREDNVYDRAIIEYAQGEEILRESERIKKSIVDYEQFIWQY